MESESRGAARLGDSTPLSRLGWRASFTLGLITLILGVVLAFRPAQSLTVIAILLGIVMLVSGVYHIVRALDSREHERVWRGVSGVLFLLAGLVLLRHLHLSIALIGLFIGLTWIVQGISALMESFSRGRGRAENGWSVFFGIVSLIAGIVVVVTPVTSVGVLTIILGAWFIIMGALEMLGALVVRRAVRRTTREGVSVPEQRSGAAAGGQAAAGQGAARQETAGDSRPSSRNIPG
jgi:uncharacterized membrane protein HdeD (DUF308 family)